MFSGSLHDSVDQGSKREAHQISFAVPWRRLFSDQSVLRLIFPRNILLNDFNDFPILPMSIFFQLGNLIFRRLIMSRCRNPGINQTAHVNLHFCCSENLLIFHQISRSKNLQESLSRKHLFTEHFFSKKSASDSSLLHRSPVIPPAVLSTSGGSIENHWNRTPVHQIGNIKPIKHHG